MAPANGGPMSDPMPCTNKINPYAKVKSSISTSRDVIIGVNEKLEPKVMPKTAHDIISIV